MKMFLEWCQDVVLEFFWEELGHAFMPSGRTGRAGFAFSSALCLTLSFACYFCLSAVFQHEMSVNDKQLFILLSVASITILTVFFSSLTLFVMQTIKRLHDINESGFWACLLIIPILGEMLILFLLMMPSHPFRNRFGISAE